MDDVALADNLAWRAAQAFAARTGRELPPIHIHIEKHIPLGAGLAGGSADAAAVLLLLAREAGMLGLGPSETAAGVALGASPLTSDSDVVAADRALLQELASGLGADVAFFLAPTACALMAGIGDKLRATLPSAAGTPLVIAWDPGAPVSTPAVYQAFEEHLLPLRSKEEAALAALLEARAEACGAAARQAGSDEPETTPVAPFQSCAFVEQLAPHLYNNLSAAAAFVSPAARQVHEFLSDAPQSLGVALSGSGGASFALCATDGDCDALAQAARAAGFTAQVTKLAGQTLTDQIAYE